MSKSILAGLAAALFLGCAAPAVAQTPPPAAQADAPEQAEKQALVRRYFEVSQFEKIMNTMMESMMAPMMNDPRIPPEKLPVLREAILEGFGNVVPQMMDAFVIQYAETFTLTELQELVAFYESPIGRSIMNKTLILTRQSGDMMERFGPIMEAEMRRQVCARIDCPAAPPVIVPSRR